GLWLAGLLRDGLRQFQVPFRVHLSHIGPSVAQDDLRGLDAVLLPNFRAACVAKLIGVPVLDDHAGFLGRWPHAIGNCREVPAVHKSFRSRVSRSGFGLFSRSQFRGINWRSATGTCLSRAPLPPPLVRFSRREETCLGITSQEWPQDFVGERPE